MYILLIRKLMYIWRCQNIFYALGIKTTLTSNQVKPADKFWDSLWKNFFFISINNNRLPNIMLSDNLEPFLYLLQTSQCFVAFCQSSVLFFCLCFGKQSCWAWFCADICSLLGFFFSKKFFDWKDKTVRRCAMTVNSLIL